MKDFFEFLKSKALIRKNTIQVSTIDKLTKKGIIDLINEIDQIAVRSKPRVEESIFAISSSLSLSGGREDCTMLGCRLKKLDQLARFAILYSDRVYINSFFADYIHFIHQEECKIRQKLYDDLTLMNYIRPLLEAVIVSFFPQTHVCPRCFAKYLNPSGDYQKRWAKIRVALERDYLQNTSAVILDLDGDAKDFFLTLSGPEVYFEHGDINFEINKMSDAFLSEPLTITKVLEKGGAHLPKSLIRKWKLPEFLASQVIKNVSFQDTTARILNTTFVTDKSIHIKCIEALSQSTEIERRNKIASEHLTVLVPFMENVSLANLLKLRKRENESFQTFRQALNIVIDEFRSKREEFDSQEARILYSDVIAPRLAVLDQRVQKAKRDLITATTRSIISTMGAITFGIYLGFIPPEWIGIAKAIGLGKITADTLQKIMAVGNGEKSIEKDSLYFLWKIKQLGRK